MSKVKAFYILTLSLLISFPRMVFAGHVFTPSQDRLFLIIIFAIPVLLIFLIISPLSRKQRKNFEIDFKKKIMIGIIVAVYAYWGFVS